MRCFLGIPVPADTRNKIRESLIVPEHERAYLKFTDQGQWHINLAFFGEVAYDQLINLVQFIGQAMETPPQGAFQVKSIQTFPNKKPILYSAMCEPEQEVMWQRTIDQLIDISSLSAPQTDRKDWIPRINLARSRYNRLLEPMEIQLQNIGWVPEFATLFRSEPTVSGHKYIPLHEYRLNL